MAGSKEKLVRFLHEKAFDPVLRAKPDDYNESERRKLKDVERHARREGGISRSLRQRE